MNIRIIGCGAMGSAIAEVLSEHGKKVSLYDKIPEKAIELARVCEVTSASTPLEGLEDGDMLILAVKPQDFEKTAQELSAFSGKMVVSIITGITTSELKKVFPFSYILRMIPNLAVRYGDGIVALTEDPLLSSLKTAIEELFAPLGLIRWIPESLCNAVTALAGSGPAFVFTLIESMVDAAIAMGFSSELGYDLVKHMVGGSLTTLYESNSLPCELKWRVTSPAGTTIEGLKVFEEKSVRSGIIETFLAAFKRAESLGK